MLNIKVRNGVLAGLCCLPLVTGSVFSQEQRQGGDNNQGSRQVSKLSKVQRSGYLGEVSESVILSGNLEVLESVSTYTDFFDDIESLKEHVKLWHLVAIDSVALDHTPDPDIEDYSPSQGGPTRTSRALAMVQIAVFDALNSIEQEYQPYTAIYEDYQGASEHAAAAYAAYNTLIVLYPQQADRLNEVLADTLDIIEGFTDDDALELGQALGAISAQTIIAGRLEDGSDYSEPNFGDGGAVADGDINHYGTIVNGGSATTGEWTPDPNTPEFAGDFNLSLGAYWGSIEPFFLQSGDQFRVPEPPALDSAEYLAAYDYVAAIGGAVDNPNTVSTSTDETRFIANYWGYDGVPLIGVPPRVYNQIVSQIADEELNDPLAFARVLAMVNVGMADAAIAAWDSKYYYNLWRPVTGIRADDGVDATITDETWEPIGVSVVNTEEAIRATPPFPAYPSGHATFGAVTFEILRQMFNDNTSFTFISDEYNGEGVDPFFPNIPRPFVPVRFRTLTEAQVENGVSRVYNGVHWDFDDTAGQELGEEIAQFLINDTTAFSGGADNDQNQDDDDNQGDGRNGGPDGGDGNDGQGGRNGGQGGRNGGQGGDNGPGQ